MVVVESAERYRGCGHSRRFGAERRLRLLLMGCGRDSKRHQELVRLKAWEEISHADIGEVLGISAHAVDMRLNRALKKVGRPCRLPREPRCPVPDPLRKEESGESR